eukprot:NODE_267_length_2174_cov_170.209086_g261_i0.p1 GENE.NODE_267_length_2174_cov_170.209086_g261_i0~~NODE_267_length_2174_cov_170.209086_g261_i0.p1  ORF type:complete len:658 (-),score=186.42 NODE_267_length_2174_cov_170.209086_g261_i0:200-2101(-)
MKFVAACIAFAAMIGVSLAADCQETCDIMIVIDRSGSIRQFGDANQSGGDKERDFVIALVNDLDQHYNDAYFGFVEYSSSVSTNHATLTHDHALIMDELNNLRPVGGITRTDLAIQAGNEYLTNTGRANVACKRVYVITDGATNPSSYKQNTIDAADAGKAMGYKFIAIGVGSGAPTDELNGIASDPISDNLVMATDFTAAFDTLHKKNVCLPVIEKCNFPPAVPGGPGAWTCTTPVDHQGTCTLACTNAGNTGDNTATCNNGTWTGTSDENCPAPSCPQPPPAVTGGMWDCTNCWQEFNGCGGRDELGDGTASSMDDCRAQCIAASGCVSYEYHNSGTCRLSSSCDGSNQDSTKTSGWWNYYKTGTCVTGDLSVGQSCILNCPYGLASGDGLKQCAGTTTGTLQDAAGTAADTCQDASCPSGTYSYMGSTYSFTSMRSSWTAAAAQASAAGGFLASITTQEEQDWITQNIFSDDEVKKQAFWFGLHTAVTPAAFTWSSGATYSYSAWEGSVPASPSSHYGVMNTEYTVLGQSQYLAKWNVEGNHGRDICGLIEKPPALVCQCNVPVPADPTTCAPAECSTLRTQNVWSFMVCDFDLPAEFGTFSSPSVNHYTSTLNAGFTCAPADATQAALC